jgi:hypothetical protein
MRAYRIYFLDRLTRKIVSIDGVEAETDEAAMAAAHKLLKDQDLEVWTSSRRVGELKASAPR